MLYFLYLQLCVNDWAYNGFNFGIGISIFLYLQFPLKCTGLIVFFILGKNCGAGWPYYAFLTAASGQLAWQIWTVDLSSRADCNRKCVILFKTIYL